VWLKWCSLLLSYIAFKCIWILASIQLEHGQVLENYKFYIKLQSATFKQIPTASNGALAQATIAILVILTGSLFWWCYKVRSVLKSRLNEQIDAIFDNSAHKHHLLTSSWRSGLKPGPIGLNCGRARYHRKANYTCQVVITGNHQWQV